VTDKFGRDEKAAQEAVSQVAPAAEVVEPKEESTTSSRMAQTTESSRPRSLEMRTRSFPETTTCWSWRNGVASRSGIRHPSCGG